MPENNNDLKSHINQNEQPPKEVSSGELFSSNNETEQNPAEQSTVNSGDLEYGRPIRYNSNYYYTQPRHVFVKNPEQVRKEAVSASLKKAASAAGLSCVLVFAVNILLSVVVAIMAILIGGVYGAYDVLTSDIFTQYLQIFGSLLMFIPPFVLSAVIAKKKLSHIVPFVRPKKKGWYLPSLFIGYGMCMFANVVGNIFSSVFESVGLGGSTSGITFPDGIYGFLFSTISVAIIPALVEEFAFRGVVLGLLRPYGDGYAIIVSAVLFGLMHGNLEQIPFAIMVGLVLGTIVCTTGSLLPAILVHFANNFISVLTAYLTASSSEPVQSAVGFLVISLGMSLMAFGFIILYAKNRKPIHLSPDKTGLSLREKLKLSVSTGGMIGAIIVTVLSVLVSFI